jgi:hypothetical protein
MTTKILDERATDQLYVGTTRFFRGLMKSINGWKIIGPRRYKAVTRLEGQDFAYHIVPAFLAHWDGDITEKLYNDYIRISGDNKGDIIPGFETFKHVIENFTIMIYPANIFPGARATMDDKGIMNIYLRGWQVDPSFFDKREQGKHVNLPLPENIFRACPDIEIIKALIGKQSGLISIVTHELAHYINSIRSSGVNYRSKGGDKQYDPNAQEYYDSTEEIQARLIQYINRFNSFINNRELDELYGETYSLMYYLAMGYPQEFINGFYANIISPELGSLEAELSFPARKRLIKRLTDVYNHYRDERHPLLIALAQDVARRQGPADNLVRFAPIPQGRPTTIKPNMRKKVFTPKTQPRTKPRPEQTIAEQLGFKKGSGGSTNMKNDKMLTKNFLRRFVLNEINVPVTGGEYLSSTDSHNVSKVHEVLQGLQEIVNVFPGHEQEIREMIDALRAMLQADEGNPTGELGKGRTGRPDSPMR